MFALAVAVAAVACGARTGLGVDGTKPDASPTVDAGPSLPPPTTEVCASARYRTGKLDVGFVLLLDRSESMQVDGKWDQVTAAITAFSKDPSVASLPVALTLFPRGFDCAPDDYGAPEVALAPLAKNATPLALALAAKKPSGGTPTEPALAGAITYARALMLADPTLRVSVVLVTDGSPTVCATLDGTIAVARDGATGSPEVLTYGVGTEASYAADLGQVSAAGGTGPPIVLKSGSTIAAELIATLREVQRAATTCELAVPATPLASPLGPKDVVVRVDEPAVGTTQLPRFAGVEACGGAEGYFLDAALRPTTVTLCPATCAALGLRPAAEVVVIAGCGGEETVESPPADAGPCPSVLDFSCVAACGEPQSSAPLCVGGAWTCPKGTVTTKSCSTCPATPHGCCGAEGLLATASCIAGAWVCPPGAVPFGEPGCRAPEQCAPTLLCPPGATCVVPDHRCSDSIRVGACVGPSPCASTTPACGCDGVTYTSECAARAAGVDVDADGACPAPPGTFECGPWFCQQATQQCRRIDDLSGALPTSEWACIPKSTACCAGVTSKCPIGCECDACAACGPLCAGSCGGTKDTITCTHL